MKQTFFAKEISPWKLYIFILGIVFFSEFCVMLILPGLHLGNTPEWLVGFIDASMLTILLVPLFGWLIIRPMQHIVLMRANLLRQFMELQEEERGRIARDLHDEIGQSFTAVLIGLRTTDPALPQQMLRKRLDELAGIVTSTLEEVRRLARGLRPAVLDHLGLVRAIEQYADDYQAAHGVKIELNTSGIDPEDRLPASVETAVYRIIQESLTNTAKHADARNVQIGFRLEEGNLNVTVSDDGQGFSRREIEEMSSTGVLGMAQRAALLQGSLHIRSRPGQGTCISLSVPLSERPAT